LKAISIERDRTRADFSSLGSWRIILRVFLPFTAAFYLSYLFRTINALISSELSFELALDAADIGFLTSVYFLSFAALQLPVGVLLDRYGPRRVQAVLLLFAAAGAMLFGMSKGFTALVLGRALIGVGVAAALTGGLKAIIQWFPNDRIAVMNGYMVTLGALGALSATSPAKLLLDWSGGWRGLFAILATAAVACALLIWITVPEASFAKQASNGRPPVSLKAIYCDRRFWGLAPLSATCVGTAWALQGLWAAPWLTDVGGLAQADVTRHLFVMAVALSAGGLLWGTAADRLRRRGIGPQAVLGAMAAISTAAQLALILQLPLPSNLSWSIIAAAGAGTVLSYAILAEYFPSEVAGRANGALNLFHFGGAFVLQYATGVIVAQWPSQDGHYPAIAYQVAFGINLFLQCTALSWFAISRVRMNKFMLVPGLRRRAVARVSSMPSRETAMGCVGRLNFAQREVSRWRLAGLGTAGLAALLGLTLAVSAVRANATRHITSAARTAKPSAVFSETAKPYDAQIAYVLAGFIKNVKSLSIDPVVVRANWIDALNYVTPRGARALNAYAGDGTLFTKIGRRTITVEGIEVARASVDAFDVRREERTFEAGAVIKRERFAGAFSVVFKSPNIAGTISRNLLGIYIDRFTWRHDPIVGATP
jgi:type IV secretory pathway TrbF-like protein/sugar phosphate permease